MSRRRKPAPAGFIEGPAAAQARGFARATYATTCGTCLDPIQRNDPIVPRSGGGYQHPRCAPGGDDQ